MNLTMNNEFYNIIENALKHIPGNKDLASDFLSFRSGFYRYAVGKNDESAKLIDLVNIDGIIDDYSNQKFWNKKPIVSSSDLPKNAIVANCSTAISPVAVNKMLLSSGVKNILSFHELAYSSNEKLSLPRFVEEMREDYKNNKEKWLKVYSLLFDEESRKTFLDVIRYRLTADPSYMEDYSVRINDQYFEDFMNYKNEIFVDAGGFDGDTAIEFSKRYPDYKEILFFEPSSQNMKAARKRTKNLKNVEYYTCGLSDEDGELSFSADNGSASAVSNSGNDSIRVTLLDKVVNKSVSFIKMDLEGWEQKALSGCKNHIINDRPKLAIAVYHKAKDFYEIPSYILSLHKDYKIYIRHYTQGWSETIMYFLPK